MKPGVFSPCARCDRTGVRIAFTWPEGRICRRCYQNATRIHGTCPSCGVDRLLPGLVDQQPVCVDCAGIPKDFHCSRCGREDEPVRKGLCAHCCLTDDLTTLLDDGTGTISPALVPLFTAFTSQTHARSARVWFIVNPHVTELLRSIARGQQPISHTTFTDHPHPRKVAFLRQLFIEHGLLEPVHLDIERFQTWLDTKLASEPPARARLIKQYARWVHLNRMHHLAETGTLRKGTLLSARQSTTVALEFLRFLDQLGTTPAQCSQANIDDWLSTGPTTRSLARGFVCWATKHGHIRPVDFPYRTATTAPIISQQERLDLLLKTLDPETPLTNAARAVATLLLLFGQPLTRIAAMQLNQVSINDTVSIAVTDDVLALSPPFDDVMLQHLAALPNQNTSAHREQRWLFPGVKPGQHLNQHTIMNRLRGSGIDLRGTKNASLRALALEIPAAIIADSLGYSYQTTDKHRRNAGTTFTDYIAKRAMRSKTRDNI